jgi:heat shock protein HtpX
MANFYKHISDNKRSTYVIMAVFVFVVSVLGLFLDYYYGGGLFFTGLAFVFAGLSGFVSYYNSDKIVLALSGAKEVDPVSGRDLHNLVENMSIASGLPKPRIYYIEDTAMNAFATGRDPEHGVICFTTGILQRLEKRELEGVIAHEMSHIGNYDIRLMSVVSVLVGSIALLSDFFTRGLFYRRGGNKKDSLFNHPIIFIVGLVLALLSPIIAQLIKLALGRRREFLADATAVSITRHPKGLADALRKLGSDREILEAANGATAHLYIVSPITGGGKKPGWFANLFSTHPPVEERIARLESL